jgi:release factor glutamine methyltransferase
MKFCRANIDVSRKVFAPRIETEFWTRKAIKQIKSQKSKIKNKNLNILDAFAGSGCIGIAILKTIKNAAVDFVDIDKEAIRQIKINLRLNKISKVRYKIYQSNLFEKLKGKKYDFILANPPYVALDRIPEVQKEVLEKEPHVALFAGKDGLVYIKKIFDKVKNHLKPGGMIFLEFDPRQKEEIEKILQNQGFKFVFFRDQFRKYRWLKAKIK